MFVVPRFLRLLPCLLLVQACASIAPTGPIEPSSPMQAGGPAGPPAGFFDFCLRHAEDCRPASRHHSAVELTAERMRHLESVQREVNARISPATDMALYRRSEHWDYPVAGRGDCEDYALEKRRMLLANGWPPNSLYFAVARLGSGESHTVLVVSTLSGDYVLDNLHRSVVPWRKLDYEWKIRQSRISPELWVKIRLG